MRGTFVNLNVNPCKMCMPMGTATALYGIHKCMTILHGSQGCSTYIRRHMATHYNEPVDIASTSLTEEGTVYGGEKNLLQGLKNLIQLYEPEVIGVATTCLAETIGEDLVRMIDKFYLENPEHSHIKVIPIPSPGYGGTQFEGYMRAIYEVVKNVEMDTTKHEKINVVTSILSPADTRYLKDLLKDFSIDAILLPDLSETLDGMHKTTYERLPSGGTSIGDIQTMAGARLTLELSSFTKDNPSVAKYLFDTYGVPYKKCALPVSLRDTDQLIKILSEISGKSIPNEITNQRGRFLDAMIDGHKYNGEARAAIFGEPDFVYSTVRLCVENGIMPMIVATGSKCNTLKKMVEHEIEELAKAYLIDRFEILDDIDFQTIEEKSIELGINILIGSSDGRRIEERQQIGLVRRSFPIHDRVGGQRLRMLGYEGALTFLDEIANVILSKKETSFRKDLYKKYYEEQLQATKKKEKGDVMEVINLEEKKMEKSIEEKTKTHPCYNCGAHQYARMHLPIAPKCNISCNYCLRKYDCPNESRPGVTTSILNPEEALAKYIEVKKKVPNLSVVGIAGPGDALANFDETKQTLSMIKEVDQDVTFCLSTNGLMLPRYARDLIELGVSHVTVTMNAIDPKIGAQIYKYVDYMGVKYYGEAAAAILLANQLTGIQLLTSKGIICKVNIVMLKGINDHHIPEVVKKVKDLGGTITNIMQLIPVKGSVFEDLPLVSNKEIMEMRKNCGETMKQMYHCRQCRADAIGTLDHDQSIEFNACHKEEKQEDSIKKENAQQKLQVAVATKSGMIVDQHFGQVSELYVYEYLNGNAKFLEKRKIDQYCKGVEECEEKEDKISLIIHTIADCDAVIAMRIGDSPRMKLNEKGIKVFTTYDKIEDSVKKIAKELEIEENQV
ncbi:nitrogenase cofactor biosynthesis protein NifB [Candidatus Galacturonibacter soehngenii]|uniref:FeMo cofactor biosynthesis protein NifB n=1 Tax=Candidatus Galacturonatibacter soehngenii TaxID=2307010 RepID=A0A7V7UC10_9FIRM|nr:nitrogenase cofactor biosynthesis protein NifB [Candidatus Galacturonibacter soehngenii]KAB1438184.1 nitrogenase cofactor biosynthesis protein NifB [Candidatus Galacturonibacter soehngenii]